MEELIVTGVFTAESLLDDDDAAAAVAVVFVGADADAFVTAANTVVAALVPSVGAFFTVVDEEAVFAGVAAGVFSDIEDFAVTPVAVF